MQDFTQFLLGEWPTYTDLDKLLRRLRAGWTAHGFDSCTRQDIELVCQQVLDGHPPGTCDKRDLFLGSITVAATWLKDAQLFNKAADKATNVFHESVYEGLGRHIDIQDPLVPKGR